MKFRRSLTLLASVAVIVGASACTSSDDSADAGVAIVAGPSGALASFLHKVGARRVSGMFSSPKAPKPARKQAAGVAALQAPKPTPSVEATPDPTPTLTETPRAPDATQAPDGSQFDPATGAPIMPALPGTTPTPDPSPTDTTKPDDHGGSSSSSPSAEPTPPIADAQVSDLEGVWTMPCFEQTIDGNTEYMKATIAFANVTGEGGASKQQTWTLSSKYASMEECLRQGGVPDIESPQRKGEFNIGALIVEDIKRLELKYEATEAYPEEIQVWSFQIQGDLLSLQKAADATPDEPPPSVDTAHPYRKCATGDFKNRAHCQ